MEAGGKMKGSRGHPSTKPYARSTGLLGRVSESVKDMLSPSWLVDLVSSVKKRTPPPESQQEQASQQQCSGYGGFSGSRPIPDLSNSYNPPHVTPTVPNYTPHIQHSTPAPHSQEPLHFTANAVSFGGLNKLDLQTNMLINGSEDHSELSEFAAPSTSFGPSRQQQGVTANNKYLSEGQSKIQQLRQELGGSITPSKEIEERGKLQSQTSDSKVQRATEASFLWANETKREMKKNDPQPPAKRHKPNFNTSVFGGAMFSVNQSVDASLHSTENTFHNSSFYSGKTMFGGASANRSKAGLTSAYQITPARKQVSVKSSVGSRSGVTSSAAKRILDCLERMSTPLSDAKKIPSYNSSLTDSPLTFTPGIYRRRSLRQNTNRDGPPVGNLSTPTQASIGRNLQKPAQTTGLHRAAMKQAGSSQQTHDEPSTSSDYSRDSSRTGGKMRRERNTFHSSKRQDEQEDQPIAPDLPTAFTLPVNDNLPKFDFAAASKAASTKSQRPEFITSSPIVSEREDKQQGPFTFSSPIAKLPKAITVQAPFSQEPFTFSSPISVDKQAPVSGSGIVSAAPSLAFTFQPSPKLKVKQKTESDENTKKLNSGGLQPASELKQGGVMDFLGKATETSSSTEFKTGSVMDVLGKKDAKPSASAAGTLSSMFKPPSSSWSCPTCMVQNKDTMAKCPCCETAKPVAKEPAGSSSSKIDSNISSSKPLLSAVFKAASGWSCPTCMVRNKDSMEKCPCCQEPKPGETKPAATVSSTKVDSTSDKPPLSSLFKAKGGWSCPTCMVSNDDSMLKCPCCETDKPGAKPALASQAAVTIDQSLSKPSLASMFKKPEGNWDCDTCMVSNKKDATKCIACETPKPGLKPSSSFTSPGGFSGFKFGVPSSTIEKKSDSEKSSSDTVKSGFTFGMKSNSDKDIPSGTIKFGMPSDSQKTDSREAKTNSSEAKPALGGIKFGAAASTGGSTAAGFTTFGMNKSDGSEQKERPSAGDSKPLFSGFKMNSSSASSTTSQPTTAGFSFGLKAVTSEANEKAEKPVTGISFGIPKTTSEDKPTTAAASFQFAVKPENEKEKAGLSSAPALSFGTAPAPSSTTATKPSILSSSGIFGASGAVDSTSTSKPETSKPCDVSSSQPTFGSAVSSTTSAAPSTTASGSVASGGFGFGATTTTNSAPSGGFSFSAKPLASSTFGGISTNVGFGGFSSTASGNQPATTSAPSGGFSFSGNSTVSNTVTSTSTTPSTGFAGFGTTTQPATKPSESSPAPSLFVFGQGQPKSDSSEAGKPLGAPGAGGFAFGAAVTSAPAAPTPSSSGLFVFGGSKPNDNMPSVPSLKRGRDAPPSENNSAKKATGSFGTLGSGIFGQPPATQSPAPSGFGSGASFTNSAITTNAATPVFGSSNATAQSGFGSSSVFGGAASQPAPGFSFGAGTKPQSSTETSTPFGFGTNQNQSNNGNPFGQPAASAPAFGTQPAQPSSNQSTSSGFNFSATPSFNFSAGSSAASGNAQPFTFSAQAPTTNMFNATASSTSTAGRRPIKKAVRRTAKK